MHLKFLSSCHSWLIAPLSVCFCPPAYMKQPNNTSSPVTPESDLCVVGSPPSGAALPLSVVGSPPSSAALPLSVVGSPPSSAALPLSVVGSPPSSLRAAGRRTENV